MISEAAGSHSFIFSSLKLHVHFLYPRIQTIERAIPMPFPSEHPAKQFQRGRQLSGSPPKYGATTARTIGKAEGVREEHISPFADNCFLAPTGICSIFTMMHRCKEKQLAFLVQQYLFLCHYLSLKKTNQAQPNPAIAIFRYIANSKLF